MYILVGIVIFGIFLGLISVFYNDGIYGMIDDITTAVMEGTEGGEPIIGPEIIEEVEEENTPSAGGYRGHKSVVSFTDDEIESFIEGMDPSAKVFGRQLLKGELTWDQFAQVNGANRNYPQHAKDFINGRHNMWLPEANGESIRPYNEVTDYVDEVGVKYKNQDPVVKQQAAEELRSFYSYSKDYPTGTYEAAYYNEVVKMLKHRHAIWDDPANL